MSVEVERIKNLVSKDLLVEAVELPTSHKSRPFIADDIEEILSRFDDDADHAHFIIRVKRTEKPLPRPTDEPQVQQFSIDSMVNETLELTEKRALEPELDPLSDAVPKPEPVATDTDYDPEFLLTNAKLLEDAREYALARNIYGALVKKGAFIPQALAGMARMLEREGAVDKAIRCYQEAIAYSSELPFHQSLAALHIKVGNDEEAAKTILHALGLSHLTKDDMFELHKSVGNCFTRLGDYAKAEHHYRKAFELNQNSDALQVNVGSLALQKLDYAAAESHFLRALEINPNNDKAISGLGMVCLGQGKIQLAHDHFVKGLRLNPNNLGAIYNVVKCAYELKQFGEAAEILKKHIDSNPVNTNILYSYAGILFHQGDYRAAAGEVDKILETNPNHAGAKELKELIQAKLG